MEPHSGDGGILGRVPGHVCLGATEDEAPGNGANVLPLEDWEVCLEVGSQRASHVLGADDRAAHSLEGVDPVLGAALIAVGVERVDVGLGHCEGIEVAEVISAVPFAAGDGLGELD